VSFASAHGRHAQGWFVGGLKRFVLRRVAVASLDFIPDGRQLLQEKYEKIFCIRYISRTLGYYFVFEGFKDEVLVF
jgi:hypothetical protein